MLALFLLLGKLRFLLPLLSGGSCLVLFFSHRFCYKQGADPDDLKR